MYSTESPVDDWPDKVEEWAKKCRSGMDLFRYGLNLVARKDDLGDI